MDYKDTAKELLNNVRQSLLLSVPDLALDLLITSLEIANNDGKREVLDSLKTEQPKI